MGFTTARSSCWYTKRRTCSCVFLIHSRITSTAERRSAIAAPVLVVSIFVLSVVPKPIFIVVSDLAHRSFSCTGGPRTSRAARGAGRCANTDAGVGDH